MSSGRSIKLLVSVLLAASLLAPVSDACGAGKGDWGLSDDRKRWRYLYSYDEPARDEWIEYDGKEYYVDSKGYLKTGWVTDPYDDCKYYTGTDGAKRYNMFTPDDYYVGPDGTRLELFNTYRREIKKQLEKIMKDKAFEERDVADRPGFLLIDLNADRYQDLVVVNHAARPERVILAAVWEPEEKKLILAAEADPDGAELSEITCNPESQTAWLVIRDRRGIIRTFSAWMKVVSDLRMCGISPRRRMSGVIWNTGSMMIRSMRMSGIWRLSRRGRSPAVRWRVPIFCWLSH